MAEPRSIVRAAVIAALLVAACGATPSTPASGDPHPSQATRPPATAGPTAAPAATAGPMPSPTHPLALTAGWESTLQAGEAQLLDLLSIGDAVLLAGEDAGGVIRERSPGGGWGPAVRPEPGATWAVTGLAQGEDSVVAFGVAPVMDPDGSGDRAPQGAAWRRDGKRWVAAGIGAPLPFYDIFDIAWDGDRFVAVGDAGCNHPILASGAGAALALATTRRSVAEATCPDVLGWSRPMAWTSPDGAHWTPDEGLPNEEGSLRRVVSGAAGPLAVGRLEGRPAAWLRDDGRWQPVELPFEVGWVVDLGTIADAYVMLTGDPDGSTIWRSSDGQTWEGAPIDIPLRVLVGTPGGLVGLGGEVDEELQPVGQPVIAVTRDGTRWTRLPGDQVLENLGLVSLVVTPQDRAILLAGEWGSGSEVFEADAWALGLGMEP